MLLLIKESYHVGNNHGALWHIDKDFDKRGKCIGRSASFMGDVVVPDLQEYLKENPKVRIAESLPDDVSINHNGY